MRKLDFAGVSSRLARRLLGNEPRSAKFGFELPENSEDISRCSYSIRGSGGQRLAVVIDSISSSATPSSALVELHALDAKGNRLRIEGWPSVSSRVGEFSYLRTPKTGVRSSTSFHLTLPHGTVEFILVGRQWKNDVATRIVGTPTFYFRDEQRTVVPFDDSAHGEFPVRYLDRTFDIPDGSSEVKISFEHISRQDGSSAQVAVSQLDATGMELHPPGDFHIDPRHGAVISLNGDLDDIATTTKNFRVARNATQIRAKGLVHSSSGTRISSPPLLTVEGTSREEIESFVGAIPRQDLLIVIDTTAPPLGHETLALRPNNLSLEYVTAGVWVVFLPFSTLQSFSARVHERILQVPRSDTESLWAALRRFRTDREDIFICSSFPSFASLTAANDLKRLGWKVVYEVRDDMEEFNRAGYSKWYTPSLERAMLHTADSVVSVSRALDEKMTVLNPGLESHTVIPNGVRQSVIDAGRSLRTLEAVAFRESSKVVGYVGHLTSAWFDWPLLIQAAQQLPELTFEIVGHGMPDDLELPHNVKHLGPKTHQELLDIVPKWKVGLIPFKDGPLTRAVDPNKIYEYFAWGLRCVSIQMGAVHTYPWTYIYSDTTTFVESIETAVRASTSVEDLRVLNDFVATMSWRNRAAQMIDFMKSGHSND